MLKPTVIPAGLILLGVILVACGDDATPTSEPTSTSLPATATLTPEPTATSSAVQPTPTAMAEPMATPDVMVRKMGSNPPLSTTHAAFHFGIHECAGNDNSCLAHPAPNYNGIIEYNPETDDTADFRCDLCTEWTLDDDGVTYTFNLHESAVWNDGEQVTAEDLVFSLDRMTDPDGENPKVRVLAPFYDSSRAIDDFTVEVKTQFPAPAFLPFLASEYMKVMAKHWVGEGENARDMKLFENIMGSGPFKLVEHEKDVKFEYVRNEDYFKENRPYWDGATLFIIKEPSSATAAFKAGQSLFHPHPTNGLSNLEAVALQEDVRGKGRVIFVGPIAPLWIQINIERAPFDDPRVRNALQRIAHREPYVTTFSGGVDELGGPFPPNAWFGIPNDELAQLPGFRSTADGQKHPDDIADAKRLLEEAGVPEGFKTTVLAPNFVEFPGIASLYADQLRTFLGWDVNMEALELAAFVENRNNGQYFLASGGYGILTNDPHDFIGGIWIEKAQANFQNWSHPRIEELYLEQARELDRVKRKALVDEVAKIIIEEDSHVVIVYHTKRGQYSALQIQNHHPLASLSDALKFEHLWCDPEC